MTYIKVFNDTVDLEVFGFSTAVLSSEYNFLDIGGKSRFIDDAIAEAKRQGAGLLRHGHNPEDLDGTRLLREKGFYHVDTKIDYSMENSTFQKYRLKQKHERLRMGTPDDIPRLEEIAGDDTYPQSRFIDVVYERSTANRWYSRWIRESVLHGYMADICFVFEEEGNALAFATGTSQDKTTEIVLVGVDKRQRGRGLGQAVSEAVLIWGAQEKNDEKALVTQQGDNVKAHRLYQSLGFRMTGAKAWYHLNLRSG